MSRQQQSRREHRIRRADTHSARTAVRTELARVAGGLTARTNVLTADNRRRPASTR